MVRRRFVPVWLLAGARWLSVPRQAHHPFPSSPPRPLSFQARGSIGESLLDGDIPASWFGAVIMEDHRSNARLQL